MQKLSHSPAPKKKNISAHSPRRRTAKSLPSLQEEIPYTKLEVLLAALGVISVGLAGGAMGGPAGAVIGATLGAVIGGSCATLVDKMDAHHK